MVAANELISSRDPHRNRHNLLSVSVLVALVAWLTFNWISTAAHVIRYYNPLPVSDYWRVIEDLPAMQSGHWSWLWRPHNEHRIIFPELVFAADELLFSGKQVLPLIASFLCYLSTVVFLGGTFWRSVEAPVRIKARALLLGSIIAGWPLSAFVLGTPFLLQWTLLQFAVVAGLVAASRISASSRRISLVFAIACGVVATFSSANGILFWPILLAIAVFRGTSRRRIIALALSAAVTVGLFVIEYHRPSTTLLPLVQHPAACFGFVLAYLSMPFGVLRNPVFGILFGLANLSIWVGCLVRTFRNRIRSVSPYEVVAFAYFFFLLLTATLTSLGRFEMGDPGFSNAKAARYLTLPLLGWALSTPLVYIASVRSPKPTFLPRVVLAVTVAVVAFMEIRLSRWLRTNDDYIAHQQWAALSLENGLFDPGTVGSVFPDKVFVQHYLPILRKNGKSIFSDPLFASLGGEFRSTFPTASGQLEAGAVLRTTRFQGGVSILGWADNVRGGEAIVLVDQSGRVVGLGRHLRAGLPRELLPVPVNEAKTWVGFVNDRYGSKAFIPYLVRSNRSSVFPVAAETSIPADSP